MGFRKLQSKEKRREYYLKNKDNIIKYQLKRYEELSSIFNDWKKTLVCSKCGEKETICLDFHHINMNEKEKNVITFLGTGFNSVNRELKKCIVVCANCHRKIHANVDMHIITEDLSESFTEFYNSKKSI